MRVDPVQPNFPDPPVSAAKVNNPLVGSEVELHDDSENLPVPAAAVVQTETQGSRPDTPDRGKIVVDRESHKEVYQLLDRQGEIVFQIPSEEVLKVSRGIQSSLAEAEKEEPRRVDVRS